MCLHRLPDHLPLNPKLGLKLQDEAGPVSCAETRDAQLICRLGLPRAHARSECGKLLDECCLQNCILTEGTHSCACFLCVCVAPTGLVPPPACWVLNEEVDRSPGRATTCTSRPRVVTKHAVLLAASRRVPLEVEVGWAPLSSRTNRSKSIVRRRGVVCTVNSIWVLLRHHPDCQQAEVDTAGRATLGDAASRVGGWGNPVSANLGDSKAGHPHLPVC